VPHDRSAEPPAPPGSSAPEPPPLPPDLPAELDDFLRCTSQRVVLKEGRAPWLPLPSPLRHGLGRLLSPSVTIEPSRDAKQPRVAHVEVGWSLAHLSLRGEVEAGQLKLEPVGPRVAVFEEVYEGVDDWVDQLNAWLAHNGYELAPIEVARGALTLTKSRRA
jgi:hypothetical protein